MTGGFAVNATGTPDTNINISTGVAYITGTPTSQNSQKLRVKCTATGTVAISANASGSTKYDWVYISISAANAANPNSAGDNVATITTSRSSSASTDDGTPPTYGVAIAVVTVANGFSTITNSNIRDVRTQAIISATSTGASTDWYSVGYTPSTITNNGNHSYTLTFTSQDLTATLSRGMRIRGTRIVAAPTQSTSLNGSTQYYNKTSPAATTFTDDFTVSAWVKLSSYAAGGIVSRYNGTSGWSLEVNASGQLLMIGYNAGAANFSQILSYQSLPLNKWVHVAGELDMSSFTNTATTSYLMIDGVDVPGAVSRGGTNPTALVQAGDLNVGAKNAGSFFPGKIAQAAYFNNKVTQATIRSYMSQTLAGTETSLVSAYSFSGSKNDLNTSNANNLTANGSAVETNADSPFGIQASGSVSATLEYGIIASISYSSDTTMVVQVPEGGALPTSGGLSAVAYSTMKAPYGFPAQRGKWAISSLLRANSAQASATSGTWYNVGSLQLNIPIGEWDYGYSGNVAPSDSTNRPSQATTLSTANNTEVDTSLTSITAMNVVNAGGWGSFYKKVPLSLSAQTTYYLNHKSYLGVNTTTLQFDNLNTPGFLIYAENAYV